MKESEILKFLAPFRERIDNLDAALIHILAERFRCTDEVGLLKAKHALASRDHDREKRQFARVRSIAVESGSDPEVIEEILKFVIGQVVGRHERVANGCRETRSRAGTPKA
ncbi:chorismate mutase [Agrobacterium vitis]